MLLQEHVIFINPTSILSIIIFIQRRSSYCEFFALIQPLFPLKKDYFHQNNIHLEITHCILAKGESSFHFSYIVIFSFIPLLSALYRSGRCPKVMYPTTPPLCGNLGVLKRRQAGAHLDRASFRFAIQTLRSHGLRPGEPHMVMSATAVSSIMYASPAWWGFTNASERSRLNRLIAALKRAGFLPTDFPTFDELARQADAGLFRAICSNPDHVLRHYFTPEKPSGHNLRPRAHIFNLPPKDPRNFVTRSLYGALLPNSYNCACFLLIVITFLSLLPCTSICKSQLRFVICARVFTQLNENSDSDS